MLRLESDGPWTSPETVTQKRPAYQDPPPDAIRQGVWSCGQISPLQLFRIAAWKSAQGLAWLSLNSEATIADVSYRAVDALTPFRTFDVLHQEVDWNAWTEDVRGIIGSAEKGTGLLALSGVGYPVATAILSFLAPAAFPVMDIWTVRAIFGSGRGNWHRAIVYAAFTKRLCELQSDHYQDCTTIHAVDQAVMNARMGCKHARQPCEHIPYPAIPLPS